MTQTTGCNLKFIVRPYILFHYKGIEYPPNKKERAEELDYHAVMSKP